MFWLKHIHRDILPSMTRGRCRQGQRSRCKSDAHAQKLLHAGSKVTVQVMHMHKVSVRAHQLSLFK